MSKPYLAIDNTALEASAAPKEKLTDINLNMSDSRITDANGDIITSALVLKIFNHFFTFLEHENETEILKLIENNMRISLEEPAKTQALDILEDYREMQKNRQLALT